MHSFRIRLGALALALAGALFLLYPVTRPWVDESTLEGATAAMSSGWWVASHTFAIVGFILIPIGLLGLREAVGGTPARALAHVAVVTSWIGVGLTLPYYGAENFGLNATARMVADGQGIDLLGLAEAIRFNPVAATTFAVGLLTLAISAVLTAIVIWRCGVLPRASGIPFALAFALFLPQFFTPPAVRIGHGLLVAAGSLWLALVLWRAPAPAPTE